ncbi:MAG: hypothetical protein R3B95_06745 [Nitrospirales bacterium]|nr:hypothetical protein [Nitrospirales bacterium]
MVRIRLYWGNGFLRKVRHGGACVLLQGRMGEAIVQSFNRACIRGDEGRPQNQLQALTAAAIRSEVPGMRLAQLPQSEQGMQGSIGLQTSAAGTQVSFSELWSSDRAFMTYGIAFLILLPGILIWSLTFPEHPGKTGEHGSHSGADHGANAPEAGKNSSLIMNANNKDSHYDTGILRIWVG